MSVHLVGKQPPVLERLVRTAIRRKISHLAQQDNNGAANAADSDRSSEKRQGVLSRE